MKPYTAIAKSALEQSAPKLINLTNDTHIKIICLILEAHVASLAKSCSFGDTLSKSLQRNFNIDCKFPDRNSQEIFNVYYNRQERDMTDDDTETDLDTPAAAPTKRQKRPQSGSPPPTATKKPAKKSKTATTPPATTPPTEPKLAPLPPIPTTSKTVPIRPTTAPSTSSTSRKKHRTRLSFYKRAEDETDYSKLSNNQLFNHLFARNLLVWVESTDPDQEELKSKIKHRITKDMEIVPTIFTTPSKLFNECPTIFFAT